MCERANVLRTDYLFQQSEQQETNAGIMERKAKAWSVLSEVIIIDYTKGKRVH